MNTFDQEHIRAYLLQELTEADRQAFEIALAKDKTLQEELVVQKELLKYIDQHGDLALKNRLKGILPKYKAAKPNPQQRIIRWLLPLAGAILILILFLPTIFNQSSSSKDLFNDHYKAYPLSFGTRTNIPENDLVIKAGSAYQQEDYEEALNLFKQIIKQNPDGKYRLALGICALETAQYQPAIDFFQDLIKPADPVYETHAMSYTALSYLQLENWNKAKEYLQYLSENPKAFKHKEAQEILKHSIFSK